MTTHSSESTTKPHWTNETADAAVQAAIEARALMLATARALGLADEDVERAPQRAAGLVKEVENLHMWLEQSQTEYNVSLIASLCQDCAKHPNRHSHGGTHCRWCGRSTVGKEGEERLTYAELSERLAETETPARSVQFDETDEYLPVLDGTMPERAWCIVLWTYIDDDDQEKEKDRLSYAELRARLIEITHRDAATCTRLAQAEIRIRVLEARLREIIDHVKDDFPCDVILDVARDILKGQK